MSAEPDEILTDWQTVLGSSPTLGTEAVGRGLWPVTATDGRRYALKRVSPWRNLPLADEARVLAYLAATGIGVAGYVLTERATVAAGRDEQDDEPYVLMPWLASDPPLDDAAASEAERIGRAVGGLHVALAEYPWPTNSYTEDLTGSLAEEPALPDDVAATFAQRRDAMISAIDRLPVQPVHGDLTPDNVLVRHGSVTGFIDFDHLPYAPRVWDVGKFLSRRLRRRWRGDAELSVSARVRHLPGFVRGYRQVVDLSGTELAALPALIAAGNLLEASYLRRIETGELPRRRLPDHLDVLDDTVDAARWQLQHWDQVAAALR